MDNKELKSHAGVTASLTVETAFVLPIFIYFMLAFLYFIQIFMIQEDIQAAITKMGLSLAKASYVFDDFVDVQEAKSFDQSIFGTEYDIGLYDFASAVTGGTALKLYAKKYLDVDKINRSCIQEGFEGLSFYYSKVLDKDDYIDVIVRYRVELPIKFFHLETMRMIQRVRLRGWTGYQVSAKYSTNQEAGNVQDEIVYITATSKDVYHTSRSCSHINLSVTPVAGIPNELRNANGDKYYTCESCCRGNLEGITTYYITSDGTRYHADRNCSGLKRTVIEVHLSQVKDRRLCSRCKNLQEEN